MRIVGNESPYVNVRLRRNGAATDVKGETSAGALYASKLHGQDQALAFPLMGGNMRFNSCARSHMRGIWPHTDATVGHKTVLDEEAPPAFSQKVKTMVERLTRGVWCQARQRFIGQT
jgi:hypothetical protein